MTEDLMCFPHILLSINSLQNFPNTILLNFLMVFVDYIYFCFRWRRYYHINTITNKMSHIVTRWRYVIFRFLLLHKICFKNMSPIFEIPETNRSQITYRRCVYLLAAPITNVTTLVIDLHMGVTLDFRRHD